MVISDLITNFVAPAPLRFSLHCSRFSMRLGRLAATSLRRSVRLSTPTSAVVGRCTTAGFRTLVDCETFRNTAALEELGSGAAGDSGADLAAPRFRPAWP